MPIDTEAPFPQVICPSCLCQWVYPDSASGQWDCEQCGWTGLGDELLEIPEDGDTPR